MSQLLPLQGTVVVDVSRMLPGAVLARTLLDLGARVIKVEDPDGGDPMRGTPPLAGGTGAAFAAFLRGAESVAIDLRTEAGAAALRRLAAHADVLVESFRPGTLERWGCGLDRLQALNPVLVTCSLSSFGQTGPDAGQVAHDLNVTALTGLLSQIPGPDIPRVQLADVGTGLLGAASILAALLARHRTGRGMRLDQPLVSGVLPFLTWAWADLGLPGPTALGTVLAGESPCYRVYTCSDGGTVALGAMEQKFWAALAEVAGLPEVAGDGLDIEIRGQAAAVKLAKKLAEKPRSKWLEIAREKGIPLTAVNDAAGGRNACAAYTETVAAPGGGTLTIPAPYLAAAPRTRPLPPAPALGEGTERVLLELGFSGDEIAGLKG